MIMGSGKQAEWHARLALLLASVKDVTFVNRSQNRLQDLEENVLPPIREVYPAVNMTCISKENNPKYDDQL